MSIDDYLSKLGLMIPAGTKSIIKNAFDTHNIENPPGFLTIHKDIINSVADIRAKNYMEVIASDINARMEMEKEMMQRDLESKRLQEQRDLESKRLQEQRDLESKRLQEQRDFEFKRSQEQHKENFEKSITYLKLMLCKEYPSEFHHQIVADVDKIMPSFPWYKYEEIPQDFLWRIDNSVRCQLEKIITETFKTSRMPLYFRFPHFPLQLKRRVRPLDQSYIDFEMDFGHFLYSPSKESGGLYFTNREEAVREMCSVVNLNGSNFGPNAGSALRVMLAEHGQGMGKTRLGRYILAKFKKNKGVESVKKMTEIESFSKSYFENAHYIYMDLRLVADLVPGLRDHLLQNFFENADAQYFSDSRWSGLEFLKYFNEPLFFHFDEIGSMSDNEEKSQWPTFDINMSKITSANINFQVYLSGAAGKAGSIVDILRITGPSKVTYSRINIAAIRKEKIAGLLQDSLFSPENTNSLKQILNEHREDSDLYETFVELLWSRSGGVPRYVQEILKNLFPSDDEIRLGELKLYLDRLKETQPYTAFLSDDTISILSNDHESLLNFLKRVLDGGEINLRENVRKTSEGRKKADPLKMIYFIQIMQLQWEGTYDKAKVIIPFELVAVLTTLFNVGVEKFMVELLEALKSGQCIDFGETLEKVLSLRFTAAFSCNNSARKAVNDVFSGFFNESWFGDQQITIDEKTSLINMPAISNSGTSKEAEHYIGIGEKSPIQVLNPTLIPKMCDEICQSPPGCYIVLPQSKSKSFDFAILRIPPPTPGASSRKRKRPDIIRPYLVSFACKNFHGTSGFTHSNLIDEIQKCGEFSKTGLFGKHILVIAATKYIAKFVNLLAYRESYVIPSDCQTPEHADIVRDMTAYSIDEVVFLDLQTRNLCKFLGLSPSFEWIIEKMIAKSTSGETLTEAGPTSSTDKGKAKLLIANVTEDA